MQCAPRLTWRPAQIEALASGPPTAGARHGRGRGRGNPGVTARYLRPRGEKGVQDDLSVSAKRSCLVGPGWLFSFLGVEVIFGGGRGGGKRKIRQRFFAPSSFKVVLEGLCLGGVSGAPPPLFPQRSCQLGSWDLTFVSQLLFPGAGKGRLGFESKA